MKKNFSSVFLFREPVPLETKPSRKTFLVTSVSDDSGNRVVSETCIEDAVKKNIQLQFSEVTLSNLVDKGVEPHALDMIDSSKLGIDEGIDRLAQQLISDTSNYVILPYSKPSEPSEPSK